MKSYQHFEIYSIYMEHPVVCQYGVDLVWWFASNVLQSHTDSNVLFASRFCLVQRLSFPTVRQYRNHNMTFTKSSDFHHPQMQILQTDDNDLLTINPYINQLIVQQDFSNGNHLQIYIVCLFYNLNIYFVSKQILLCILHNHQYSWKRHSVYQRTGTYVYLTYMYMQYKSFIAQPK